MIGSPAIEIQRVPRGVQLHLEGIERLLLEKHSAELGMSAKQGGQRMTEQLCAGLAEQRAHPRADIGDAIVGIDRPEPTNAALLIFLEQEARAFAPTADVDVGLELVECPAGNGSTPKLATPRVKRIDSMCWKGTLCRSNKQRAADAG